MALRLPLATTVYGVMLLGLPHVVLELRYVAEGWVHGRLPRQLTGLIVAALTGVVILRSGAGWAWQWQLSRSLEILLTWSTLLAVVAWLPLAQAPRALAALLLACAGVAAQTWPSLHFLALTHLHNLVPAWFLYHHAAERHRALLPVLLLWALVVPALLLGGVLDPLLAFDRVTSTPVLEDPSWLVGGWMLAGTSGVVAARVVATFAFLQMVHYAIWVGLLPRFPRSAPSGSPPLPWLALAPVVAIAGAVLLTPVYLWDYRTASGIYGSIAAFHALLELPVVVWASAASHGRRV